LNVIGKQNVTEVEMRTDILRIGHHWRMSLLVTLAVLYLPFSWLLLMDYPWNGYRLYWLKLWCILPGFLGGIPFHPHDAAEFTAMGITTLFLIGLLMWVGSHNRMWLVVAGVLGLVLEIFTSLIAYAVFRA
jgi:hypothetical protein